MQNYRCKDKLNEQKNPQNQNRKIYQCQITIYKQRHEYLPKQIEESNNSDDKHLA